VSSKRKIKPRPPTTPYRRPPLRRTIPVAGILILTLFSLYFTWKTASETREIVDHWARIEATVNMASSGGFAMIQYPWQGSIIGRSVRAQEGYKNLTAGQKIPLYVNPAKVSDIRRAAFLDLWRSPIGLCVIDLFLIGAIALLIRAKLPPEQPPSSPPSRTLTDDASP